jgi:hypothetical protein
MKFPDKTLKCANLNKCYFFKENVTYCGHEIGSDGLKKSQDKIDAILKVKKPENVTQLVKIFQVFLFRLTGHDHIIEYTLDTSGVDVTAGPLARGQYIYGRASQTEQRSARWAS